MRKIFLAAAALGLTLGLAGNVFAAELAPYAMTRRMRMVKINDN